MNKLGMVLGAAAIATLAGCKDPDYKYDNDPASQNDVKVVGDAQPAEVKPSEITAVEPTAVQPVAVQPVVVPAVVPQPTESAVKPAAAASTVYVVKNGDSLSKIAKKNGVSMIALRSANPALKGDKILIGQKLNIPAKSGIQATTAAAPAAAAKSAAASGATKTYVVKSGDTLGAIAIANGISVRQLKDLNGLTKDSIRIGQKLKVPAVKGVAAKKTSAKKTTASTKKAADKKAVVTKTADNAPAAAQPAPASAEPAAQPDAPAVPAAPSAEQPAPAEQPASAEQPAPAEQPAAAPAAAADAAAPGGATYVVQEGDDMTGISIRWGVSAAAIRELNNLGENDQLKVGQVIKLPADAQQ